MTRLQLGDEVMILEALQITAKQEGVKLHIQIWEDVTSMC